MFNPSDFYNDMLVRRVGGMVIIEIAPKRSIISSALVSEADKDILFREGDIITIRASNATVRYRVVREDFYEGRLFVELIETDPPRFEDGDRDIDDVIENGLPVDA